MAVPHFKDTLRFSPTSLTSCAGFYLCDPDTNVWKRVHNYSIEQKLCDIFMKHEGLSKQDVRHVLSRRGRADIVHVKHGLYVYGQAGRHPARICVGQWMS
jgi:hypothetical protein